LVRRFLRAAVKGREFLKRNKSQALSLGKKYDKSPDDVRSADYDATHGNDDRRAALLSAAARGW
jgi:hypothetical protein